MVQQILNYRIERLLSEGGMSRVYLGVDPVTGQRVAIKELLPHLATLDDLRERFRREAQFMVRLNHPNIVRSIQYEEKGNCLFLVQEYIEGINLEEYIINHRGLIPEEEAKALFCQLLDVVAYGHENDVIHCGIQPSSVTVTGENQVKVINFCSEKIVRESISGFAQKPLRRGWSPYQSPEQVNGREVDERTDIYLLGVLLHQMLTGKSPYDIGTYSEFELLVKIVKEPLPRMKGFNEHLSCGIQAIVDKATAKEKSARYQSCKEFMQAINSLKGSIQGEPWWTRLGKSLMVGAAARIC